MSFGIMKTINFGKGIKLKLTKDGAEITGPSDFIAKFEHKWKLHQFCNNTVMPSKPYRWRLQNYYQIAPNRK